MFRVQISILEKISLVCENDGGLKSLEVKGELVVTTFDPRYAQVQVHVSQGENKDFQFKVATEIGFMLNARRLIQI